MVSVFTPTYNRYKLLQRLYKSLERQSCKNFEWIVVDDGSDDETDKLIEDLKKEKKFKIVYRKIKNSGKYMAYNEGLRLSIGDLFVCVDSDDFLCDDAIEKIESVKNTVLSNKDSCGFIAKKIILNADNSTSDLPVLDFPVHLWELDEKYGAHGEKTFVFVTDIAKKYMFPEIENEKFFPEIYLYNKIDENYKFSIFNFDVMKCEYQDDGYSRRYVKIMLDNPTGFKMYYSQLMINAKTMKSFIGYAVKYQAFNCMSDKKAIKYTGKRKIITAMLKPVGLMVSLNYKIKAAGD